MVIEARLGPRICVLGQGSCRLPRGFMEETEYKLIYSINLEANSL